MGAPSLFFLNWKILDIFFFFARFLKTHFTGLVVNGPGGSKDVVDGLPDMVWYMARNKLNKVHFIQFTEKIEFSVY